MTVGNEAEREATTSPGRRRYRLATAKPLGVGAQGIVRLAVDLATGDRVAVKVPRELTDEAVARLQQEAELGRRVESPYVVRTLGSGVGRDGARTPYVVTEFVEGVSLKERLAGGPPLTALEVAEIGLGIATGVAAIHAAGVIHRDIKPDNILLGRDGRPRILDFGVAVPRATRGRYHRPGGARSHVSPTLLRDLEADRSAYRPLTADDIFALGVTLSEMQSGLRTPAEIEHDQGARPDEALYAGRALEAGASAAFGSLVAAMTSRHPRRRPTAEAVVARLAEIAAAERSTARNHRAAEVTAELPDVRPWLRTSAVVGSGRPGGTPRTLAEFARLRGGFGVRPHEVPPVAGPSVLATGAMAAAAAGGLRITRSRTGRRPVGRLATTRGQQAPGLHPVTSNARAEPGIGVAVPADGRRR